jgi:hypothetical protein
MKIIRLICFVVASTIALCSCGNIEEDIYIGKSGAGSIEVKSDMLEMFSTMSGGGSQEAVDKKVWGQMPGAAIDSVIDLRAIAEERGQALTDDQKALFDKLTVYLRGSKKSGKLYIGALYPFASIADLNSFSSNGMKGAAEEESAPGGIPTTLPTSGSRIFTLTANSFSCLDQGINLTKDMDGKEKLMMNQMVKDAELISRIHSKDRIKSASGIGLVSFNDSVATFKYDYNKVMKGKLKQNFVIEFY